MTAADHLREALRQLGLEHGDWTVTIHAADAYPRDVVAVRQGERRRFRGGRLKLVPSNGNGGEQAA